MAFAKMRRLERARDMLQEPDATTTVTGVALLCGFLNQGHFARDYRERFDELLSRALKSSNPGNARSTREMPQPNLAHTDDQRESCNSHQGKCVASRQQ